MAARGVMKICAGLAALSLCVSSPAAAAAQSSTAISPWIALSALGTSGSSVALCASTATAAASTAAQGAAPGCVLPAVDAPPPVAEAPPAPAPIPAAVVPASGGGIGALPILLGLAALAGIAALVLSGDDDDDDDEINVPVSP